MILAIDPGAHPGYAVLDDKLELVWCGIVAPETQGVRVVLCERPWIYPGPRSKADPNDIGTLCITAGKLVQPWITLGAKEVWVPPVTWKGNVPKQIHHARILSALAPSEQSVVARCLTGTSPKYREDAMDAVGLSQYGKKMGLFR